MESNETRNGGWVELGLSLSTGGRREGKRRDQVAPLSFGRDEKAGTNGRGESLKPPKSDGGGLCMYLPLYCTLELTRTTQRKPGDESCSRRPWGEEGPT